MALFPRELRPHKRPHQLRDEPARSHFEIRTDLRDVPVTVNRVVVWQDGPVVKEVGKTDIHHVATGITERTA